MTKYLVAIAVMLFCLVVVGKESCDRMWERPSVGSLLTERHVKYRYANGQYLLIPDEQSRLGLLALSLETSFGHTLILLEQATQNDGPFDSLFVVYWSELFIRLSDTVELKEMIWMLVQDARASIKRGA